MLPRRLNMVMVGNKDSGKSLLGVVFTHQHEITHGALTNYIPTVCEY